MAQVVVRMKTIDLRKAELQPVSGEDVKTLQALLNLFLTAGDVGEDGSPILPLTLDGTADAKTKQAALAFQTAAHLATDAIVGPLTWRKLVEQTSKAREQNNETAPSAAHPLDLVGLELDRRRRPNSSIRAATTPLPLTLSTLAEKAAERVGVRHVGNAPPIPDLPTRSGRPIGTAPLPAAYAFASFSASSCACCSRSHLSSSRASSLSSSSRRCLMVSMASS